MQDQWVGVHNFLVGEHGCDGEKHSTPGAPGWWGGCLQEEAGCSGMGW